MYTWQGAFDPRERQEIEFARLYLEKFGHGTDGHTRLTLIAKLSLICDKFEKALNALEDKDERR